jgi:septation ring formation regulator EzrA
MAGKRGRRLLVGLSLVMVVAIGVAVALRRDDAPSQEAFAERANEICREAERSLKNVGEGAESPEEIIPAIDRVIEEIRDTMDELADLERPEGNAGQRAEEFVEATRREIEEVGIPGLQELREAVENRDQDAARRVARRLRQIDSSASNQAAREVGATACAD